MIPAPGLPFLPEAARVGREGRSRKTKVATIAIYAFLTRTVLAWLPEISPVGQSTHLKQSRTKRVSPNALVTPFWRPVRRASYHSPPGDFSLLSTPLAADQRADRVAQPGAIIPPVLELATGDMTAEQPPLTAETLAGLLHA